MNNADPVSKLEDIVALDEVKTDERFKLVANVFHLNVELPKSNPLVPGTKRDVPELSLKDAKVAAPPGVDPGENEPE